MRLPDVCIRRPVFAVMLIGGLVVLGLVSVQRLGVDLFPRVEFPMVTVLTTLEGASPETMEREVSQVLEESINTIEGIRTLRSSSRAASASSLVRRSTTWDPSKMSSYSNRSVSNARTCCIRSDHCWSQGRGSPMASFHAGN